MVAVDESKVTLKATEKNIIAGGVAGCVAKTITAPLSRLTVLYQVGPLVNLHSPNSTAVTQVGVSDSLWKTSMEIVRKEGVLSLWRGNFTSAVIHRLPYSSVQFSTYEALKTAITHHSDSSHDNPRVRFLCGAVSGAVACISCYPLDIIRTRLIVSADPVSTNLTSNSHRKLRSVSRILGLMADIVAREGFRGLYRGLGATLAVTVPTMGINFTVYGHFKQALLDFGGCFVNKNTGNLSPYGSLLAGSMSGVFSACATFPGDVIRKRMQVMGAVLPATPPPTMLTYESSSVSSSHLLAEGKALHTVIDRPLPPQGYLGHVRHILQRDGLRGFYRGITPEILKVCPTVAIMFCTYEAVKDVLDERL